jgi:hypothetical protein
MLNLCGIVAAILKMVIGRNFLMSGINSGHHYLPTYQILMISDNIEFCGIVAAMLKMATDRNFSMSGINSGHHYLPTYQILMISDTVEFSRYCGGHQILMISENVEFLPPIFYAVFWQTSRKF